MKECFKCKEIKTLSDFYKHPAMADGHVNKCKECNKKDVRENREKKIKYYREYDAFRYKRDDTIKNRNSQFLKKYRQDNPEKYMAHTMVSNAVMSGRLVKPSKCNSCGEFTPSRRLHAHHHDYYKPLDVTWLCVVCHAKEHPKRL